MREDTVPPWIMADMVHESRALAKWAWEQACPESSTPGVHEVQ